MADDFALNGFKVVIPDLFNGDPCPLNAMEPEAKFDLGAWLGKHGSNTTAPIFDAVIGALKSQGISRIGTTGYCYGARGAFDLALENTTHVTVVTHPSLLQIPADLEVRNSCCSLGWFGNDEFIRLQAYKAKSQAPLLINSCEVDSQFPIPAQKIADELLTDFGPGYKRTYSEGCTHGFAARGDPVRMLPASFPWDRCS